MIVFFYQCNNCWLSLDKDQSALCSSAKLVSLSSKGKSVFYLSQEALLTSNSLSKNIFCPAHLTSSCCLPTCFPLFKSSGQGSHLFVGRICSCIPGDAEKHLARAFLIGVESVALGTPAMSKDISGPMTFLVVFANEVATACYGGGRKGIPTVRQGNLQSI